MHNYISGDKLVADFDNLEGIEHQFLTADPDNLSHSLASMLLKRGIENTNGLNTAMIQSVILRLRGVQYGPALELETPMYINNSGSIDEARDDYKRVLDEIKNSNVLTILTDQLNNHCLLLNDKAEPGRLIWSAGDYLHFDFMKAWKDSMESFEELMVRLKQDGRAENFTYNLKRVDGSVARYTKDYEIVYFLGRPARLSHSREWQLIKDVNGEPL